MDRASPRIRRAIIDLVFRPFEVLSVLAGVMICRRIKSIEIEWKRMIGRTR